MRIIGHLDMDAFFAAVEERANPRFFGLPIVIGADPQNGHGRGVVSTANYKAREYGIHSAMPISAAWDLAEIARLQKKPEAIFLPPNMNLYAEVSSQIMQIVRRHALTIEQTSIDEAYFDLSPNLPTSDSQLAVRRQNINPTVFYQKAKEICQKIKNEIKQQEKLTCSIGIGPNKLIAKIASAFKKPDGLTIVKNPPPHPSPFTKGRGCREEVCYFGSVEKFLDPLPIRKIPGIGPKTEEVFKKLGVKIIKDLKKFSEAELAKMLGKWGLEIFEKARGIDDSPVSENRETKSIGEQETFPQDTLNASYIFERLGQMAKNIIGRLQKEGFKNFRTIVAIVRFSDFETKTKNKTLDKPTGHLSALQFESLKLLTPFFDKRQNPRHKLIRLIGLRVEKLSA